MYYQNRNKLSLRLRGDHILLLRSFHRINMLVGLAQFRVLCQVNYSIHLAIEPAENGLVQSMVICVVINVK